MAWHYNIAYFVYPLYPRSIPVVYQHVVLPNKVHGPLDQARTGDQNRDGWRGIGSPERYVTHYTCYTLYTPSIPAVYQHV